jgi:ABC-type uncharacterized transport system auxiliary subunit
MRIVVVLCAILLAGCVAGRPVHYYTIEPSVPAATSPKADGPVLLVGPIATPEVLQDGRIRYRAGANEAGGYEYHRWVERPGSMVRNSLMRSLRASGSFSRVLESGSVDGAGVRTRISLHLELIDRKTNRAVWDRAVDREEPVTAKNIADVVQSLDRNLQAVVSELATEIGKAAAK